MRLSVIAIITGTFAASAALALFSARYAVDLIETGSGAAVMRALDADGMTWADVDTDGLQVYLHGTAPDEAARFSALSTAGRVVDTARLIDQMLVEEAKPVAPPRFSLELLRNASGLSAIGLIPAASDRAALLARLQRLAGDAPVSDLLEVADHPAPDGWEAALRFATQAMQDLPRSKVSVSADGVSIKASTESEDARRSLAARLRREAPDGLDLTLDLTAPRPVVSPFALRFVIADDRTRFDACVADTEAARNRILRAARAAGATDTPRCRLALGTPSREWGAAAERGIAALAELGGGTLTMTNTEIALVAERGTPQPLFDRVVGELDNDLPAVFALTATLPEPPPDADAEEIRPEFIATLSPEGAVQLRGRLTSALTRQTAASFAQSHFGAGAVHMAARVDADLPGDWPVRTLASIEALARLANGAVIVTPDSVSISGRTGQPDAQAEIAALLATKLGEGADFEIDVTYVEALDPIASIPTPEECEAMIKQTIGSRKITFEPGSATLDASAVDILDELADVLKPCGDIPLEIGGHTDSQGRESMNQTLSRDRAQAVLNALRDRFVPVRDYTVVGYGEAQPIADNDTEQGREANRRIEFRLIGAQGPADAGSDADATDEPDAEQGAEAAVESDATEPTAPGAGPSEDAPDATAGDDSDESTLDAEDGAADNADGPAADRATDDGDAAVEGTQDE